MFSLHEKSFSQQPCCKKSVHMICSTDKLLQSSLKGRRKCPDVFHFKMSLNPSKYGSTRSTQEGKKKKKKLVQHSELTVGTSG